MSLRLQLYFVFFLVEKLQPSTGESKLVHYFIATNNSFQLQFQSIIERKLHFKQTMKQKLPSYNIKQLNIGPQILSQRISEFLQLMLIIQSFIMQKEQIPKTDKTDKVKTKVRFTSLDIAAMVAQLQVLIGLRVSNIYDINPTTYIIKAAKSEQKYQLLIQNGVRFHFTEQKPDKKRIPSGFTMRFRRHLRSKRVESVRQVGVQRVIVMTFGSQTFANHLILQFYSQGNIILTDHQFKIIQCIRSHQFTDKIKTAVGEVYPFEHAANIYIENIDISPQALDKIVQQPPKQEAEQPQPAKKKGKEQGKGGFKAKDIIFKMIPCLFPQVIQHLLTAKGINPDTKLQGNQGRETVLKGAQLCFDFLKNFLNKKQKGYLYKKGEDYFQFSPYANCKYQNWALIETESFGSAVSEYFSKYKKSAHEEQQAFEELAWKKYEQIRKDQQQRVKKLIQEQQTYGGKAELIQKNVQEVEAVIKIISTMQVNGYSWQAMERMISESRKSGDPLANMIHNLNPSKRQITVLLSDATADEPELCPLTPVQLHVDYNAYTNATMYYESRKKQQQKEARTREASDQVLKLAEKDALKKIEKKKNQILLKAVPTRKQMWFEKFYWFISSDGWLIISGRDSHQNELLVKRYMKTGDLYMHSDYGGAASTIIKGPPKAGPAPRITLDEAAIFTVCRSKAWDTKIISSSWWVYHDQVSKSAPTGEFLPTGSFMIRGKRNFVHPNRMEMGLTLLYRLDNQSMLRKIEKQKELTQINEEQQTKQEAQRELIKQQSADQPEEQEFAIIDLEAQARLAKEKKRQKANKNQKQNKGQIPTELKKQASVSQKKKDSQSEGQEDSDSEERENKKDSKKKESKKDNKKTEKGDKSQEPIQKHKNRNKKKLKKLQKYMEEQDQDERQIIMKMLGAKQMKHIQKQEQEEQQTHQQKNQKGKKLPKKKGLQKYIGSNDQQQIAINTDKVLFLKDKKKEKEQSSEDEDLVLNKEDKIIVEPKTQKKQEIEAVKESEVPSEPNQVQQQQAPAQQNVQQEDKQAEQSEQQVPEKQVKVEQEEVVDQKTIDSEFSELMRLGGRVGIQDKWDALIPMCAPYVTIKDNKFKVKLVPGGLKKGKAARNIMGYFVQSQLQQGQKAFVRALPQQEVINALIGNVKLGGAGLLKIQQKQKAGKKQKRKQQDKKAKDD